MSYRDGLGAGVAALCSVVIACSGSSTTTQGTRGAPRDTAVVARADTAAASAGVRPAAATDQKTVLFIGTSLTAGLGLEQDDAFPALLQRQADSAGLPAHMVNAGLSGETSAGLRRRIDWLLRGPADVIVLETGANDGLRGLRVDSTRANVQAILDKIRVQKPGARVLLVQMEAPPNLGSRYTADFHAMFPELAKANGVTLLPFLLEGVAGKPDLNQSDGIHPNETGERIVAQNVWRVLGPFLRAERR